MDRLDTVRSLASAGNLEEALAMLDSMIGEMPLSDVLLFERGKLRWRAGDRPGATSDYASAVRLNPDSPAARALEQARDVADFFNPDLYNP